MHACGLFIVQYYEIKHITELVERIVTFHNLQNYEVIKNSLEYEKNKTTYEGYADPSGRAV
jgi:hypothetical protein